MLKALLIDDEERATDALELMIEKCIPDIKQVKTCNDSRKASQMIHKHEPDLVFLDIRMPHLSGFEVLQNIPNKKFKVIFTTAFNEYAIKAIRFSAFDYLLKPIDVEELIQSVKRFKHSTDELEHQEKMFENMLHNIGAGSSSDFRLTLPTKEGLHFFHPHEITRCEAVGNYTRFHIKENKNYLISKTLGGYEELLAPYNFIRVHKSHLVNKQYVSFIDHDGFLIMKDSSKVEVSRRRKEEVVEQLKG